MESVIFSYGDYVLTLSQLVELLIALTFLILLFFFGRRYLFSEKFQAKTLPEKDKQRIWSVFKYIMLFSGILACILILHLNFDFQLGDKIRISLANIIGGVIILQLARLLDWFVSNVLIHRFYSKRDENPTGKKEFGTDVESSAFRIGQYIVYVLAIIFLLKNFNLDFDLYPRTINGERFDFKISNILFALLVILIARLIVWILKNIIFYRVYKSKEVDIGGQFALNQLLKYVVYVVAIIIALQYLGINMTLLLGGAAALLVGVGLGLQQTFNDFFSGLVLLFERTVAVGDVLEIGTQKGVVKKIGIRSSIIETRDNVTLIIPNSHLVNQDVINWTHYDDKVRFSIELGVAYGSDTELVKKILLQLTQENPYILEYPAPFVRFHGFGKSSLDFGLFFYSRNYLVIEDIKSDLRFEIDKEFRKHNVSIPFPHHQVILKNAE